MSQARHDLATISRDVLHALGAGPDWVDHQIAVWNRTPDGTAPLFNRMLLDRMEGQSSPALWCQGITRLIAYYKALPEFTEKEWRQRRADILGNGLPRFHSTLAELALHEGLTKRVPGLAISLLPAKPGAKTPDYRLEFGKQRVEAELKSILSEQMRATAGQTQFGSWGLEPKGTRKVWQTFLKPILEGQVQTTVSLIFVDISLCDKLGINLVLPQSVPALRESAEQLLRELAKAGPALRPAETLFVLCSFDPVSYALEMLIDVPKGS